MLPENHNEFSSDDNLGTDGAEISPKPVENGNKLERQVSFKIDQSLSDDIDQAVKEQKLLGALTDRTNYIRYVVENHRDYFDLKRRLPLLSEENRILYEENTRLKIGGNLPIPQENPVLASNPNDKAFWAMQEAVKAVSKDISERTSLHVATDFITNQVEFYYTQFLREIQ